MAIKYQQKVTQSWENIISLTQTIGGTQAGKILAKQWAGKIALILAGIATTATPADALKINATYSSEIDLATAEAIEASVNIWEKELKDPVTLNINFNFADNLPTGVLAGAQPSMIKVKYRDYLTALGQDSLSNEDISAVQNLLVDQDDQDEFSEYLAGTRERRRFTVDRTDDFDLLLDNTIDAEDTSNSGNYILDNNGNDNNERIWLTRANGKALGLIRGDHNQLDANIVISSLPNWDMDSSDGISANAYDFETVIRHEVAHGLGFVSGGDVIEYMTASSTGTIEDKDIDYVTPLNTYMYSDESAALGVIDLRLGQGIEKYLSFDGGATKVTNEQGDIAFLSTGGTSVGGDGYQNSHWKNNLVSPLGIINPALDMGMSIAISNLDLRTLDLMGWDLVERKRALMNDVGLDWDAFQLALDNNHQAAVDAAVADWEMYNPGEETIRGELEAELWEFYEDVDSQIIEQLLTLKDNLNNPGGEEEEEEEDDDESNNLTPEEQIANSEQAIWNLINGQDNQLQVFSQNVRDVKTQVPGWLDQDTITLSNLLENANRVEIKELHKILEQASEAERLVWEDKISQALALFLDNPQEALDQLKETNNFHNNMGGGGGGSGGSTGGWGGWWTASVTDDEGFGLYNYQLPGNIDNTQPDMGGGGGGSGGSSGGWGGWWASSATRESNTVAPQETQSVPEPSSLIALIALGGIGFWTRQRNQ
ncbi:MAG: NF038122 family metalloprotease [Crocosphaera sp.]